MSLSQAKRQRPWVGYGPESWHFYTSVSPSELRLGGPLNRLLQMAPAQFDPFSSALAAAARHKREMARRTRRLASGLSWNHDRETLMSYAEQLECEAEVLERQTAAPQQ